MHQYLEDRLDPKDLAELDQHLRASDELQLEMAQHLILELLLRQIGQQQTLVAAAPRPSSRFLEALHQAFRAWPWRLRRTLALAVGCGAVVLCLVLVLNRGAEPVKARLARVQGQVTIERAGREHRAVAGMDLRAGDRLKVAADASATVRYEDSATWFLVPDSADLSFEGPANSRSVLLRSGSLSGVVSAPGAQSRIRFGTTQAEAVGSDAEFTLVASSDSTRLHVWAGTMRLSRLEDGTALDVVQGESALAQRGTPLRPSALDPGRNSPISGARPAR